jgi:NAD(P)-dependent dehydrogenase (short-subunit alcohol dehydrogenase family)
MTVDGRNVLVTAGAKHLGAAIAEVFAERGANVAINYRTSRHEANALEERLTADHGGTHAAVQADVADTADVTRMIQQVESKVGPVNILVNNAGPFSKTPFAELAEDEWDQVLDSNLKAAYLCTAAVVGPMKSNNWGRIINVSAVSAFVRNRSVYGLSKASLHTLTESLALELAPDVTVNAIAPGQILESLQEMSGIDPGWAESVAAKTPLGRLVTRREVAEAVAALCTEPFDMLTGAVVPLDGGLRLPRF